MNGHIQMIMQNILTNGFQDVQLRSAEIGKALSLAALPSRQKRLVGHGVFLDHAGPVSFPAGDGLDVGPHPHISL